MNKELDSLSNENFNPRISPTEESNGLTLIDALASNALTGLLADGYHRKLSTKQIALDAYNMAYEMLKARKELFKESINNFNK